MTDGRHARRDRNRDAVLDAAIALFEEGALRPHPEEIAARAGVSTRSVHRYFTDREALWRAVIERNFEQMLPHLLIDDVGQGSTAHRIDRFVDVRLAFYDKVAAAVRAARAIAHEEPLVGERLVLARAVLRQQIERQFSPELDEGEPWLAEAVDAFTQLEAIEHLRDHRGLDPDAAGAVLRAGLAALFAGQADRPAPG